MTSQIENSFVGWFGKKNSKNEGTLNFHEIKGTELWKITIDYRNAAKGQWDKLKLLNKEDIKDNDLKRSSEVTGILAYQEYRAACKIADNAKLLKKQVKLRGSLYVSNKFLEVQLYALSAILYIAISEFTRTETKLEDNLDNTLALVRNSILNDIYYFVKNVFNVTIDVSQIS